MSKNRPLVRDSRKDFGEEPDVDYLVSVEPCIIDVVSGPSKGFSRPSYITTYSLRSGGSGAENKVVEATYPSNTYIYILDKDTDLKFDDEDGVARFSSKNVDYVVRAIQESDSGAWDYLQEWKAEKGEK